MKDRAKPAKATIARLVKRYGKERVAQVAADLDDVIARVLMSGVTVENVGMTGFSRHK